MTTLTLSLLASVTPGQPPAALLVLGFVLCVAGALYFGAGLRRGRK